MVYDEPGHILQRKWVMLTDPNDRGKGAQGYVKLTVMVIGPGDEVPVLDTVVFDAEEDIEDNLLRPAGVELEPVDLSVRVYAAEDLPQMDPSFKLGIAKLDKLTGQSGKENCDPYAIVSFAGKKVQTQVIENSYYPEFNEELHLPMQIPSMCDKIKLQFLDSDLGMLLNQDDIIGTHYISLSQISSTDPEKGFLPSFGPAWINIYGAPREFETFEAEYADVMNKGMEEGCAYRGRVLLEINGTPASSDLPDPKTPLTDSDKLRVQPYLSRADYQLRVAFLEGTLISQSACKDQIEFEVSIGTVGNKFEVENDGLVQFSTTQPEFAVFDGVYYHYMPWHNKKPCIELSSEWEDVVFRFQSLNRVRSIIRALNTGIEYAVNLLDELVRESDVAIALGESVISVSSAGASTRALGGAASPIPRTSRITANGISLDGIADPDLVTILVAVCNALINAARSPLPDLPEGRYTKLDNYLREWREDEKVLAADLAQENRDQLVQGKKSPLGESLFNFKFFYFYFLKPHLQ